MGADPFYLRVISELIEKKLIARNDSVLVVCGGETDQQVLSSLGFENATISNLDEGMAGEAKDRFAPFRWIALNAQKMELENQSYDFVIVHSGLHHLACPPAGIVEMFRVAKKGIIGFEPNKNIFTSIGVKMGFGQEYETAAVHANACKSGGLENSEIPNFIYRFCRDDIYRAIQCAAPYADYRYLYWFTTRMPARLLEVRNPVVRGTAKVFGAAFETLGARFHHFANNMAFCVLKKDFSDEPRELFPWLTLKENGRITINRDAIGKIYIER